MNLRNLLGKLKNCLVSSFMFLLIINSVNALGISIYDNNYHIGETFQAEIESKDVVRDLDVNDFVLYEYKNGTKSKIKFTPFYDKIDSRYIVYFDLENEGNFSFGVRDVPIKFNNTEIKKTVTNDFSVVNNDKAVSIRPAYFMLDDSLELTVINSKEDVTVNFITPDYVKHVYSEELVAGGRKRVFRFDVDTDKVKESFNITMNYDNLSYDIPVFIKKKYEKVMRFLTDINILNKTMDKNEKLSGSLKIQNIIDDPLDDLNFILTGNLNKIVRMNVTKISRLNPDEIVEQHIWVNERGNASGEYIGDLIVNSDKGTINMKMQFIIKKEVEEEKKEENITERLKNEQEVEKEEKKPTDELFPLQQEINFASETQEKNKISRNFIMFLVFIMVIGIITYLLTQRGKEKKTFREYIKDYERTKTKS